MATQIKASGLDAQELATRLLQRTRSADPDRGLWEAADVQWWWRRPSASDDVEQPFWLDDDGPVAGILLTGDRTGCQVDPIVVPGAFDLDTTFAAALEAGRRYSPGGFDIPVGDDDTALLPLARGAGLTAGYTDSTAWLHTRDVGAVRPVADGFVLVDRTQRADAAHPMRKRNGERVAERLEQCSLYDPELDLWVESADGRSAGFALFWADPVTRVGLVEPVRVEDEFQRRGLASALVSEGVARLAARGMERVKVSFGSDIAGATYQGVGFRPVSTTTWYGEKAATD